MGDNRYTVKFEGKKICAVGVKFAFKAYKGDALIIKDVELIGGCPGQGKVLTALLNNMPVTEAIIKLHGIKCGDKPTSCAHELIVAIEEKLKEIVEE